MGARGLVGNPDSPLPNYVDPVRQTKLNGLVIAIISCTVVIVVLRLFVRLSLLKSAGPDDVCVFFATTFGVSLTTISLIGTEYGWGYHTWDVKPEWTIPLLVWSWIAQVLWILTATMTKLSICASYMRLSKERAFSLVVKITMGFITMWGLAFLLICIFRCKPVQSYWLLTAIGQGKCINDSPALMTAAASNIITDFWLVLMPIPTLWGLQLPARQRYILIFIMGLGLFSCICGIVRIYYLHLTLYETKDVTWYGYDLWFWTTSECNVAILCTSLPPLRALGKHYFPRLLDKLSTNRTHGHTADEGKLPLRGYLKQQQRYSQNSRRRGGGGGGEMGKTKGVGHHVDAIELEEQRIGTSDYTERRRRRGEGEGEREREGEGKGEDLDGRWEGLLADGNSSLGAVSPSSIAVAQSIN